MEFSKELEQTILNLHRVHSISRDYNHALELDDNWKIFEPTKFIYAYFTFNLLYNIDWKSSFDLMDLQDDNYEDVSQSQNLLSVFIKNNPKYKEAEGFDKFKLFLEDQKLTESKRRIRYTEFLFDELTKNEILRLISKNLYRHHEFIESEDKCKIILHNNFLEALDSMREGGKIKSKMVSKFKHDLTILLQCDFEVSTFKRISFFVSMVRNNIFHGSKNIIQMTTDKQRLRLKLYTAIINALNEGLFEVIRKKYSNFYLPSVYDFEKSEL